MDHAPAHSPVAKACTRSVLIAASSSATSETAQLLIPAHSILPARSEIAVTAPATAADSGASVHLFVGGEHAADALLCVGEVVLPAGVSADISLLLSVEMKEEQGLVAQLLNAATKEVLSEVTVSF